MPHARWSLAATIPSGRRSVGAAAMRSPSSRPSCAVVRADQTTSSVASGCAATAALAPSTDEGESAAAGFQQVIGREPAAGDVVEGDGGQRALVVDRIHQHDRDAPRAQVRDRLARSAVGGDQHALDLHALEQAQVLALLLGVVVVVADEDAIPRCGGGLLGTGDHRGEERVGDVDHRHAEQPAAPGAQLLRGLERHVPEVVRRLAHARDQLVAHSLRAVQGVGDGADRHARALGDIADPHSLHRVLVIPPGSFVRHPHGRCFSEKRFASVRRSEDRVDVGGFGRYSPTDARFSDDQERTA